MERHTLSLDLPKFPARFGVTGKKFITRAHRKPVMIRTFAASLVLLSDPCFAEPIIVAHRGSCREAPENTVPSFELAWKQGADAIEGDFHLTRDGKVVCIHDYDTARVAGKKLVVKDNTLEQLRALDAGAWFKPEWKGTRLPTFAEVAATVPPTGKFYIEVKCGPEILPELLREIAASGLRTEQMAVISFNPTVLRELKKKAPDIKACWLSSFKKQSPLKPSVDTVLATLRETKADGFSSSADERLDADYIKHIREAGFEYHCWTVDDPKVAANFLKLGALSITTNRPGFLRDSLNRKAAPAAP
jgi:glycerophosphoryl diester phosphodiesterase